MSRIIKKFLFFFSIIFIIFSNHYTQADWITKKSDKSKELIKLDDMYSKGYLNKSECEDLKSKLLKVKNPKGLCDDVKLVVKKEKKIKIKSGSFKKWIIQHKHNDIATWNDTYTVNLKTAMEESKEDCYVQRKRYISNVYKHKCLLRTVKLVRKNGEIINFKIQNTKDKNELLANYEYYLKDEEEKLQAEVKEDEKNIKKLKKKYITKKAIVKFYDNIFKLPKSDIYVAAITADGKQLIGFVNQDKNSKMITAFGRKFRKVNIGEAFINDGKTTCKVISEVDDKVLSERTYTGTAILNCSDETEYVGNWVQSGSVGQGIGISNKGNTVNFYFAQTKKEADEILRGETNTLIAKIGEEEEKEYVPKQSKKNNAPVIKIAQEKKIKPGKYNLKGNVSDKDQKNPPYLYIDDELVEVDKKGNFNYPGFTLEDTQITVMSVDKRGKQVEKIVKIIVEKTKVTSLKLAKLDPSKIKSRTSEETIAVIVGVEKYDQIAPAKFAKNDAEYFSQYVQNAFKVKPNKVKLLVNDNANYIATKKILFKWLKQNINPGKTKVIIFYSGHGLPSDKGGLYILTKDSDQDFIEDTSISRNEIIKRVAEFQPKEAILFFDTCYSGYSRDSEELLIASAKPLFLEAEDNDLNLPENFSLFTASKLKQKSSSLSQNVGAKFGIFSYFLMKGLEGEADLNKNRIITNSELLEFLNTKVPELAMKMHNREQNPELIGNPDKVIIRY